jgi:hypothetical protein
LQTGGGRNNIFQGGQALVERLAFKVIVGLNGDLGF